MASALGPSEQALILQQHNQARQAVGSPPLTWSDQLASAAQQWANACRFQHSLSAGTDNAPYGENLAYSTPQITTSSTGQQTIGIITPQQSVATGLDGWLAEKSAYQCGAPIPGCQKGQECGHYTQMISNLSTSVGCARTLCPTLANAQLPTGVPADFLVCRYSPAGNLTGATVMNPQTCSAPTSLPTTPITPATPISPTTPLPAFPSTPSLPSNPSPSPPPPPTAPTAPTAPTVPQSEDNSINWILSCSILILLLGAMIMGVIAWSRNGNSVTRAASRTVGGGIFRYLNL